MKSLIFFIIGFALALAVLFMEFTVFQTAQEEEKRRVAGTPGKKDQRNKIIIFQFWRLTT